MIDNQVQIGSLVYLEYFPEHYGIVIKIYENKRGNKLLDVYWLNKKCIGTVNENFYITNYKLMNENNYCKKDLHSKRLNPYDK